MVRPAFDIQAEDFSARCKACKLFIEVNEKQLTFAWIHPTERSIIKLKQFHAALHPEETVVDLLKELLVNDEFSNPEELECCVIYNYAESTLAPAAYHNLEVNKALSELNFGIMQKTLVLSDKVEKWELYTIYRIPREIHALLQNKFRSGKYWHFNSLILSGLERIENDDPMMRLYFYPDKFTVLLWKGSSLLQLQTFFYQVPEDVAFYLLNICRLHGVIPEGLQVYIAGLIEAESALYHELGRYFLQLNWIELGLQNDTASNYPSHYFSPLVGISVCV